MIRTDIRTTRRIYPDTFTHCAYISGPNSFVAGHIKSGFSKAASRGCYRDGPIRQRFRVHDYDGVAIGQREHDFHARAGNVGQLAHGIAACVYDIPIAEELPHPSRVMILAGARIHQTYLRLNTVASNQPRGLNHSHHSDHASDS